MDSITLQNYRCFGPEEQTARLAPLTLLVGPNSTGKTSFLALIRALWDVAFREVVPNFREEPFDLGSFGDIVHDSGGKEPKAGQFMASFRRQSQPSTVNAVTYLVDFTNQAGAPWPTKRSVTRGHHRWEVAREANMKHAVTLATPRGTWIRTFGFDRATNSGNLLLPMPVSFWQRLVGRPLFGEEGRVLWDGPERGFEKDDVDTVTMLSDEFRDWGENARPFASAPVRSRPRRTYDPVVLAHDAEGDSIPSYLANVSRRAADEWRLLKYGLEGFGRASGLFDEISVRSFGKSDGDPFQVRIRKFSKRRKGPWRNLIDVGYGVSQALPILSELLRPDGSTMLLLQQPEVHLHPQAQAALGTLFCNVAAGGRQLVVETHSDYIIDRVRMDVRDQTTGLKPEDVSILYFEPGDLDVKIHSIRIDQAGNVLEAPRSYGDFFMDEINRSIGLAKPNVRDSR